MNADRTATAQAITSAMTVAQDVADGRVSATDLEQVAVAECRRLFATVIGGDDPLFGLQVEVARRVLDRGGLSVDELAEWVTVLRRREDAVRASERDADGLDRADAVMDPAVAIGHSAGVGEIDEPEHNPERS